MEETKIVSAVVVLLREVGLVTITIAPCYIFLMDLDLVLQPAFRIITSLPPLRHLGSIIPIHATQAESKLFQNRCSTSFSTWIYHDFRSNPGKILFCVEYSD